MHVRMKCIISNKTLLRWDSPKSHEQIFTTRYLGMLILNFCSAICKLDKYIKPTTDAKPKSTHKSREHFHESWRTVHHFTLMNSTPHCIYFTQWLTLPTSFCTVLNIVRNVQPVVDVIRYGFQFKIFPSGSEFTILHRGLRVINLLCAASCGGIVTVSVAWYSIVVN